MVTGRKEGEESCCPPTSDPEVEPAHQTNGFNLEPQRDTDSSCQTEAVYWAFDVTAVS